MHEIQNRLLIMLKWFDNFCRKNDIRYYLVGGTMLGAVRHGGFIPWDDDIDVALPRADYEKLKKLLKQPQSEHYILETPEDGAKDFKYCYCKLYDTTTTLVESGKRPIKRGIYIDVFPLDGIGNTREEAFKNFKKIKFFLDFLQVKNLTFKKHRQFYKNIIVVLVRFVSLFVFSTKRIIFKLQKLCEEHNFDDSTWGGNLIGAWRYKEIMPRTAFGTPTEIKFEGINVFGVERPDEYLTHLYGDWRKLPPEEKRVSHHDFILCDLNHSYLEENDSNI